MHKEKESDDATHSYMDAGLNYRDDCRAVSVRYNGSAEHVNDYETLSVGI